jgi:hypothetical protein
VYEFNGDIYSPAGLRKQLGVEPDADLNVATRASARQNDVDLEQDHNSHDAPITYLDKPYPLPSEGDYLELDDDELGFYDAELRNPTAFLTEDNKIVVVAEYTENLLWNDGFTTEELDDNSDIVRTFFHNKFNVDIIENGSDWDYLTLEFSTQYEPEEFSPLFIAGTFRDRVRYNKFRNESDPGTYGSVYAYTELRELIDAAKKADKAG